MDGQNLSPENFSFSRLLTHNWRQFYTNRLQWHRWVLRGALAFHLAPTFGKLYWHYSTHHAPSILPDFLAFVLSVAARIIWLFLFRDPAVFLMFKRPRRAYRWVVWATVALTTLPNSLIHVWALKMAFKKASLIYAGVVQATSAIVLWIPITGLVWWMAWKFLLGVDESDEEFEPIFKTSMIVPEGQRQYSVPALEPYTDDLSVPLTRRVITNGYLAQAYEEQRFTIQELPSDQNSAGSVETQRLEESHHEEVEEQEQVPNDAPNATSTTDVANNPRCQTIARFEYMRQSHSGPHSWLSFRIIPLILSSYATVLLIVLPILVHEDREYNLRAPSPTIKKSLYLPLGMYLLSFYALKHRPRASLFERVDTPPPPPWKKMFSILPSWVGTGGTFKNLDTGDITVYDPRRRAFPWRAQHQPALVCTPEYLQAYNATSGACTTFWGHLGRQVKTEFRTRPTIHRIGFVFLALCITFQGYWNTVFYNVPNVYEEILKQPKTITAEDIARILRIVKLWQAAVFSGLWFFIMAFMFAGACVGSMLVLFFGAVWKYVPKEEKERIAREAQEQMRREGRIRLE